MSKYNYKRVNNSLKNYAQYILGNKAVLVWVLLFATTFYCQAQQQYFEIFCTSTTYFDPSANETIEHDLFIKDKMVFSGDYISLFENSKEINGRFDFGAVQILEVASGRIYKKSNFRRSPYFYRMSGPRLNLLYDLKKTGKTKTINGRICDEYVKQVENSFHAITELFFYVSKEVPFINFFGTTDKMDGFVMGFQMVLSMNGSYFVENVEMDVKEITYDSDLFQYEEELKKQFPPDPILSNPKKYETTSLPPHCLDFINKKMSGISYHPHSNKNRVDIDYQGVRSITHISEGELKYKTYYDSKGAEIYKYKYSDRIISSLKQEKDHSIGYNRNERIKKKSIHLDTIFGKDSEMFTVYDHANNQIATHYPVFKSWSQKTYDKEDKLISSIGFSNKESTKDSTLYYYDENKRLIEVIRRKYERNLPMKTWRKTRTYYSNGLPKETIDDEDKVTYSYRYSGSNGLDSIYVFKEEEEELPVVFMYYLDEHNNLIREVEEKILSKKVQDYLFDYYKDGPENSNELLREIEHEFRCAYLQLFTKIDSIGFSKVESRGIIDNEIDQLSHSNFLINKVIRYNDNDTEYYHFHYFPDIQVSEADVLKEDKNSIYYKVYYIESLDGVTTQSRGEMFKTLEALKQAVGDEMVQFDPFHQTIRVERDFKFAIFKKDKTNGKWTII
ncbi:MAG: hypothetical protein P1U56_15565 [Saprospiraceae bacterium]|nr:hypothetical protein [Saprospiraceae bacterium]